MGEAKRRRDLGLPPRHRGTGIDAVRVDIPARHLAPEPPLAELFVRPRLGPGGIPATIDGVFDLVRQQGSARCHVAVVRLRCLVCGISGFFEGGCVHNAGVDDETEEPCANPTTHERVADGVRVPICETCAEEYDRAPSAICLFVPSGRDQDPAVQAIRSGEIESVRWLWLDERDDIVA